MDNEIKSADTVQGKCPACGGFLVYSPEDGMLACEYCGAKVELDLTPADVAENDYEECCAHPEYLDKAETQVAEVACGQCGAHTTFPENTTSFNCAFCGTPIVLKESVQRRSWKPEYILPFKIGKKSCNDLFFKWVKSLWFAPNGFSKDLSAKERMKGVYLPYWTYDADTLTDYSGARGTDRQVSCVVHGRREIRTVTDWMPVSGKVSRSFDDVFVPASNSLPADVKQSRVLSNWDKDKYVAYNEQYVRGFLTELYQKDFKDCFPEAKKQMEYYISVLVRTEIGGSRQRVERQSTAFSNIKFKHVLLPVWLSAYRYKGKSYVFAINGRTGHVYGQRPWSALKIAALAIVIAALLAYVFSHA